jgi:hypothetical protein
MAGAASGFVRADLIGHRHRVRDRRQGRNRERAIAKRTGPASNRSRIDDGTARPERHTGTR